MDAATGFPVDCAHMFQQTYGNLRIEWLTTKLFEANSDACRQNVSRSSKILFYRVIMVYRSPALPIDFWSAIVLFPISEW